MKKLLMLMLTLSVIMSGCSSFRYQLGETSTQFFKRNNPNKFELVKANTEWQVYRTRTSGWTYDPPPPFFIYFHNGTLYQIDRGERAPNIIIENR